MILGCEPMELSQRTPKHNGHWRNTTGTEKSNGGLSPASGLYKKIRRLLND
jgi:hypothetical protein